LDTQPPSTPAHFDGRFTSGVLRLTWSSAADNVGVDRYELDRNGKPLARISARLTRASLRGFHTRRRTVFTVRALDAAGNQSPASNPVTVSARARPAGLPRKVPGWTGRLLAWERHGRRGSRPVTPVRLPAWYARWRGWLLQPYRIVSGR
jgi:hypothetical protein